MLFSSAANPRCVRSLDLKGRPGYEHGRVFTPVLGKQTACQQKDAHHGGAIDVAGAEEDATGAVAGAVAVEDAAPDGDVPSGFQSAQLSLELPPLGVGDLGSGVGGVGFGPGACCITTRLTRFTQRSSNPELAPWSLTW